MNEEREYTDEQPASRSSHICRLRSSVMLHSVDWQLVADVATRPIGPIFKGQAVLLILEDEPIRLPRNVANYQLTLVTSQKNEDDKYGLICLLGCSSRSVY
jgi:hypothetical protein